MKIPPAIDRQRFFEAKTPYGTPQGAFPFAKIAFFPATGTVPKSCFPPSFSQRFGMKATIHHETNIVTRFRTFEIHRKHVGLPGNGRGFDLEKCKKSVNFWIFGFLEFRQSHASYSKKKNFFLRETTKEFLFLGCFLNTFSGNGSSTALHTTSPSRSQNFWCNFWNFANVTRRKVEKNYF